MTIPRAWIINDDIPGCFHLVSRCVRRAFLCGDQAEHRQEWLRAMVHCCAHSFAIEVYAYAFMANHFHLVVRTIPDHVASWSAVEVAQRWLHAHPRFRHDGTLHPWSDAEIHGYAANAEWVEKHRGRLKSVSWFMKTIKESVARRANREDHCTGHFWEGRFKAIALLDQPALVACMAYVDLNPIRAGIAETPETSHYTSIQQRIQSRQSYRTAVAAVTALNLSEHDRHHAAACVQRGPQADTWLAPLAQRDICPLDVDSYLDLVDATGRIARSDKRGSIPAHLLPILQRLDLDVNAWIALMSSGGRMRGSAIGTYASRARAAAQRCRQWFVNTCAGLFIEPHTSPPTSRTA